MRKYYKYDFPFRFIEGMEGSLRGSPISVQPVFQFLSFSLPFFLAFTPRRVGIELSWYPVDTSGRTKKEEMVEQSESLLMLLEISIRIPPGWLINSNRIMQSGGSMDERVDCEEQGGGEEEESSEGWRKGENNAKYPDSRTPMFYPPCRSSPLHLPPPFFSP